MVRTKFVAASLIILFALLSHALLAQNIVLKYNPELLGTRYDSLLKNFSANKDLPEDYELQALLALSHYPELSDTKIKFKFRKGGAPFVSRPTVWSTFFRGPKKRTYLIFIRTREHSMFDPILLANMPFDAQVGVLGHELAHSVDFTERGVFKMINVIFGNLSWKYLDKFEFETDRRAIEHGLGHQLLAWSEHAVKTLRINEPTALEINEKMEGILERERYMRPATIKKEMGKIEEYNLTSDSASTQ